VSRSFCAPSKLVIDHPGAYLSSFVGWTTFVATGAWGISYAVFRAQLNAEQERLELAKERYEDVNDKLGDATQAYEELRQSIKKQEAPEKVAQATERADAAFAAANSANSSFRNFLYGFNSGPEGPLTLRVLHGGGPVSNQ
jgi:septal ring factor EnvC (AmiA/AmiB activator)